MIEVLGLRLWVFADQKLAVLLSKCSLLVFGGSHLLGKHSDRCFLLLRLPCQVFYLLGQSLLAALELIELFGCLLAELCELRHGLVLNGLLSLFLDLLDQDLLLLELFPDLLLRTIGLLQVLLVFG